MTKIIYELKISEKLLGIIKDFVYEMEYTNIDNINDFIIEAIIEKYNNDNEVFDADINENGFIDNE